jgi:transposase-like protein
MILKCPKCKSKNFLQKNETFIRCMNCNTNGNYEIFNYRTQDIDNIFVILKQLAQKNIRIGQIFSIIDLSLKKENKDMFYIENDDLLTILKKLSK